MDFILKHKNYEAAVLDVSEEGKILNVREVIIKERLPLGCLSENNIVNDEKIKEWWNERGIPVSREDYQGLMRILGNTNSNKLLMESRALSLSDHYWIDTIKDNNKWEDVNFYENGFDSEIGELMFIKLKKIYGRNTPDFSSGGNLRKRWEINKEGQRVLVKSGKSPYMQEPVNEKIASELCKRININHVSYTVSEENQELVSICANMTDKNTELIEASRVYDVKYPSYFDMNNRYNHYIKMLDYLKVKSGKEMLDKMMVLDFLILNYDRHFRNFGVLRNSDSLDGYVSAPIYDSGSSFFHEDRAEKIKLPEYVKIRTECFDSLENQLNLVKNWSWLNLENLKDFGKDCYNILLEYKSVEKARAQALGIVMQQRIKMLEVYLNQKG
ncbi:MAG: HipA domain-containing protein [Treponema sp.]|jgi:hypothetical protein|nr:HipA domain-containing protein [Treponema sp.]